MALRNHEVRISAGSRVHKEIMYYMVDISIELPPSPGMAIMGVTTEKQNRSDECAPSARPNSS